VAFYIMTRFGWAVIQLAKRHVQDPELFTFPEGEDMSDEEATTKMVMDLGVAARAVIKMSRGMQVRSQYARS
jgi:hypothetical protein